MSARAGEVEVAIKAEMSRFDAELRQLQTRINQFDRTATQNMRNVDGATRGVTRAIMGLVGGIGALEAARRSIGTLANFGQEMSTVAAITGATADEFVRLSDEAQRLGSTTRFSASQAAEGMAFLARAGFSVDEALTATEGTLRLAQAGALDLGSAADIASNILTGFRLEVDQTARVVDVLAFAANNSNTNVYQLGEAMKFVAPVAAGLGVPIEEAAAAIGSLSDAGLQGSLAGTGLRRVLSELESPSQKTADILASLGVRTDQVRVSQVGLTAALQTLAQAGVDTGLALEIFGDRGGPAFEVLSSAIPRVVELTGELGNAAGTAQRIADVMDDNLNGALLSVKSAAEAVILSFGELQGSTLEDTARGVASGLRLVADNAEIVSNVIIALTATYAANRTAALVAATANTTFGTALQLLTVRGGAAIVMSQGLRASHSSRRAFDRRMVDPKNASRKTSRAVQYVI